MSLFKPKSAPEVTLAVDTPAITDETVLAALYGAFSDSAGERLGDAVVAVDGRSARIRGIAMVPVEGLFAPLARLLTALDADIEDITSSAVVLTIRA